VRRVIEHIRRNTVAYLALFVALGGTSYAALNLPNHSINPVKLNPRFIGGYVRAWASVRSDGRVVASGGGVRVLVDRFVGPGHYIINWRPRPTSPCETVGSVDFTNGPIPGYLVAEARGTKGRGEQSTVQTFNPQGQPAALAFDVELVCSTPR
jgi:hypothetical protein